MSDLILLCACQPDIVGVETSIPILLHVVSTDLNILLNSSIAFTQISFNAFWVTLAKERRTYSKSKISVYKSLCINTVIEDNLTRIMSDTWNLDWNI